MQIPYERRDNRRLAALVRYYAGDIVALFGLSDRAAEYCIAHLRTVAIINIVLDMYIPLFGLYQGTGHSAFPMIVACVALGMRVLVTYLLRYSPFLGHTIIWWNGIFGFSRGFLITWLFYISGKWQKGAILTGNGVSEN